MSHITITLWINTRTAHLGERRTFVDWAEFARWVAPPDPPPFAGSDAHPGWSPATFTADHRKKDRLEAISVLALEHDAGTVTPDQAAAALQALNLGAVIINTKSYIPEVPRLRILVPLSRDITAEERLRIFLHLDAVAGLHLAVAESRDPARFWFQTSRGPHPHAGQALHVDGPALDVDSLLPSLPPAPIEPPPLAPAPPPDRDAPHLAAYVRAALDRAYHEIANSTSTGGTHHTAAAREAYSIGGLVGAGALTRWEAEQALLAAIRNEWRPSTQKDVARTIRGQIEEGSKRPRTLPEARARAVVLRAIAQGATVSRPADLIAPTGDGEGDGPTVRAHDLAGAAGALLAEGRLEIGPGGALTMGGGGGVEDEERDSIQEEGGAMAIDRIESLLRSLDPLTRRERTPAALGGDVLAWACWLPEGSAAWETLRAGLRARGVSVQAWTRAVRAHREQVWGDVTDAPKEGGDDSRPVIIVSHEEHETNDAAGDALAQQEGVYQRGSQLVDVVRDAAPPSAGRGLVRAPGAPRIRELPAPLLRDLLTRVAQWREWRLDPRTKVRALQPTHPPDWAVKAIHQRGTWEGIPELTGVIEWPLVRPSGEVVTAPGYDPTSGILYAPSQGADVPPFETAPTQADAVGAAARISAVIEDFPFASEVDRAAWFASLLTPLARHAFDGPAPLFAITANIRGAGKTRLVRIASEIVAGREPNLFGQLSGDEAEERKRITALALGGDPLVLIDNVFGPFGGAILDAALTSTFWSDRLLGVSTNVRVPLACTWYATGNNLTFKTGCDTSRRTCLIKLDSGESPEERTGFTHPDIIGHVQEHRRALLGDALTILSAWLAARAGGARLGASAKPWGTFEAWSEVVRGAVVHAGLPDPGEARGSHDEQADAEVEAIAALLEGLGDLIRDRVGPDGALSAAVISRTLIDETTRGGAPRWGRLHDALEELHTGRAHPLATKAIAVLFRRLRGRPVHGLRLAASLSAGERLWYVETTPTAGQKAG